MDIVLAPVLFPKVGDACQAASRSYTRPPGNSRPSLSSGSQLRQSSLGRLACADISRRRIGTPRKTRRTASCFRAAVSLRRRVEAGSAAICEVSAVPARSRSTFFCSVIQHINHPLGSCLKQCLKKLQGGGQAVSALSILRSFGESCQSNTQLRIA